MKEQEIKDFFPYIKNKIWIVLIMLVLSISTTFVYTKFIKKPIYKSSVKYVLISTSDNQGITTSEVTLNEKLISTYKEIIKNGDILERVINNLKLENITAEQLSKQIKVEQISTSSMLMITVTNKNPEMAQKIANEVGKEFSREIQELYNINNVSMISKAKLPTKPANQSNKTEIVFINGGAIALSLLIIFVIYYFDNTINDSEQIETKLELPILGNIPLISRKKNIDNVDLIVHKDPKSTVSEGIRTIRTNLQFSNIDGNCKKIMVTSSMPGEGKSFTSINIATALAQNNNKVLIVDCDMRRGRIHRVFGISNNKGLSNLLIDNIEKNYKKYIKKTDIDNLFVIPSGMVPPNPSELLDSNANKKLISILESDYDYIIFDCAPTNGLPDSLIMAKIVDKVVIVCSMNTTPIDLLSKTKSALTNIDANIAGVVVNKTKTSANKYYGHYYG